MSLRKRSDQRHGHRTAAEKAEITRVYRSDPVEVPELDLGDNIHPQAEAIYESLKISSSARYYQESDWQRARVACLLVDKLLRSPRPSAKLYQCIQKDLRALLTTAGDRRTAGIY